MNEYILENSEDDKFGNAKVTYGYSRFLSSKYKGKGHGKLRLSQCKDKCQHPNFAMPILYLNNSNNKYEITGQKRVLVYTCKLKAMGLSKCKQCNYITAKPFPLGTRCPCCSRILSFGIHHRDRTKSKFYVEPARIE